jgi:hypothetical protein
MAKEKKKYYNLQNITQKTKDWANYYRHDIV